MKPKRLFLLFFLLLIFGGGMFWISFLAARSYLLKWAITPRSLIVPVEISLERGTPLTQFADELQNSGLIDSGLLFEIWVKFFSRYSAYQAGHYRFEGMVSPKAIDAKIRNGEIYQPTILELQVPEGFTAKQIFERAIAAGVGTEREFSELNQASHFINAFPQLSDLPDNSGLEGYLFPATYRFTRLPSAEELLTNFLQTFFERLPPKYEESIKKQELSLHQAVIIASLIEREAMRDEERPLVAEVILNRLSKKYPLAVDATIIYGIPNFDGNLRRQHLRDEKNRYNTRIHPGLPPGPICSPGTPSLTALLNPSQEGYLYYVVDAEDFSKHRFSLTLSEHNNYVRKYWKARKKSENAPKKNS